MTFDDQFRQLLREELRPIREAIDGLKKVTRSSSDADEMLTYAQAAAAAGWGVSTISDYVRRGRLNRYGEGRKARISRTELMALMTPKTQPRAAPAAVDIEARAAKLARGGR
jgi:excisionase family DNA binding protein